MSQDAFRNTLYHKVKLLNRMPKEIPDSNGTEWIIVKDDGPIFYHLGKSPVIVIGSEGCDINISSPTLEKKHALLCFDRNSGNFSVKDLQTNTGTYLNEKKLVSNHPKQLKNMDVLRFASETELDEKHGSWKYNRNTVSPFEGNDNHYLKQTNGKRELRNLSSTLDKDSGRGSSSIPSSPAKEMSPVLGSSTSPIPTKLIETDRDQPNFSSDLSNSITNAVVLPNVEGEDIEVANELFSDPESSSPPAPDHQNKLKHLHKGKEQKIAMSDSSHLHKKLCPMAFTVDFGEDDEKKKTLGIADSISKFAPRHRKNLSLTKIEDIIASQRVNDTLVTNNISDTCNREYESLNSSTLNPTKKKGKARKTLLDTKSTMNSSSSKSKPKATVSPSSKPTFPKEKFSDVCNNNIIKNELVLPTNHSNGDDKSETGTYTIDEPEVQEARRDLDSSVDQNSDECATGGKANGQFEWVREWAESAAKHSLSPVEVPETQSFLQDTENLVSALQERMTRKIGKMKNNQASKNAADDARKACHSSLEALQSFKTRHGSPYRVNPLHREASVLSDSGYALGYTSDSSSVEENRRHPKNSPVKYNRAFAIRRNNATAYDSEGNTKQESFLRAPTSSRVASPKHVTNGRPPISSPGPFSRTDGGRFSLRVSKSKSPEKMTPPARTSGGNFTPTRPLTLTSPKSVVTKNAKQEINNTNKIRTTPPPNASSPAFNRKPSNGSRSNSTLTAKEVELANWKRRKNYDPMRAAAEGKRKEGTPNKKETMLVHPEAVIPEQHYQQRTSSVHSESFQYRNSPEDLSCLMDERGSSHSSSPSHHMMTRSVHEDLYSTSPVHQHPQRQKNKLEALDSLVIATIHSLSIKVRTASRELLEKLQIQHMNDENGALLEEMVSQLKDLELSSSNSSPAKSPSKELSGTLKNLKKLEQVILVLDRVLCDDDSDS